MFSVSAVRVQPIKDLKDLSVFLGWGFYRHAGPKGPEETFSRERSRGTGPRATDQGGVCHAMRRSGSGDSELRSLANRDNLVNPAPLWLILISLTPRAKI